MTNRIQPPISDATEAFWDATRDNEYLVQWCDRCDTPIFHPREACPGCLRADRLGWRRSAGTGTVYAHSVQHRPAHPGMADRVPYVVALVDVDAGGPDGDDRTVRIMTNIIDVDPATVTNGDAVMIDWEPLDDGRNLAVFRPAAVHDRSNPIDHHGRPATSNAASTDATPPGGRGRTGEADDR